MYVEYGTISFMFTLEDKKEVKYTISGDSTLDEVIETFEHFIESIGYQINEINEQNVDKPPTIN